METTEETRGKSGRPRVEIDADQVTKLAALSCSKEDIAWFFGVSERTLERRLADDADPIRAAYTRGLEARRDSLLRMMWESARAGQFVMMIWLSKNLLGWKDRHEYTVADARSLAKAFGKLSDEELLAISVGKDLDDEEGDAH